MKKDCYRLEAITQRWERRRQLTVTTLLAKSDAWPLLNKYEKNASVIDVTALHYRKTKQMLHLPILTKVIFLDKMKLP